MRRLLALAASLLLIAAPAAADWIRIDSPSFTVFGEVGEKRTREFAAEFERFREALGRIVPGASVRAAVPAVVFIFRDQRSFGPYRPLFNGKPIALGGYFYGGRDLNLILLAATDRDAALHTIFHEYSHLVIANVARGLPAWLGEGLAEYYSTFEVRPDGRRAMLGRTIDRHLIRLNTERMLTLEELMTVQRDSPLYNEGERRSTFYAQSWALVHMLLNGEPRREKEFNDYVRLVSSGRSALEAWREVFPDPKVFDQLGNYVRRSVMTGFAFTFDREIAPATFATTKLPEADVLAALGDVRRHTHPESAAAHLDAITGATPYVHAIRGLLKQDQHDTTGALDLLLEAARTSDDWLVLYRAATGLERIANAGSSDESKRAAEGALAALDRVLAAKSDLPHAVALRGLLLGPGDEGLAAIRRARELAPGHEHYSIWQAQFHMRRGEFSNARALLAPLLSPALPPHVREYARSVMGQAVQQEEARRLASERRAAAGDPAAAAGERPYQPGEVLWVFRELKSGEERIEGILERIECPRGRVMFHIRQGNQLLQVGADKFEEIDFITYRGDLGGSISCGPRTPPDAVYVTVSGEGSARRVVAVEFLPQSAAQDHP